MVITFISKFCFRSCLCKDAVPFLKAYKR